MTDTVDITARRMAAEQEALSKMLAEREYEIPPGEPGECDWCGEDSPRLIKGACAPCRDKYRLD